tara:strand:+ start:117 stop:518 length:402 start_codon:yes stop_codon:yes gene_type:complete
LGAQTGINCRIYCVERAKEFFAEHGDPTLALSVPPYSRLSAPSHPHRSFRRLPLVMSLEITPTIVGAITVQMPYSGWLFASNHFPYDPMSHLRSLKKKPCAMARIGLRGQRLFPGPLRIETIAHANRTTAATA